MGRLALLLLAMLSLLAGLNAALLRLGALAPVISAPLADVHGVLMIFGFLGTAICLERAVALQSGAPTKPPDLSGADSSTSSASAAGTAVSASPGAGPRQRSVHAPLWAHVAPLASGLGGALVLAQVAASSLLTDPDSPVATTLASLLGASSPAIPRLLPGLAWCLAMAALCAIYLVVWFRRQRSIALLVQLLGAVCGLGGIALWTRGLPVALVVVWWLAFLVLTIVGERLELARIAFLSPGTEPRVLSEALVLVLALPLTLAAPGWGYTLLGAALAALVVDVGWHDVARRTVRLTGLPRLAGASMLTGYAWALVPALMWLVAGPALSGHPYDIAVHSLTIGFTMSMVLAHAPIIVPAIARRQLPYHPVMWAVWALLEIGLLVRVVSGVRAAEGAWRLGGALGVVAMLTFVVTTVSLIVRASRRVSGCVADGDVCATTGTATGTGTTAGTTGSDRSGATS